MDQLFFGLCDMNNQWSHGSLPRFEIGNFQKSIFPNSPTTPTPSIADLRVSTFFPHYSRCNNFPTTYIGCV